jgi:transketolase C-terminal domain/subunit
MSLEDLGLFRNIPQGVVLVPSDGVSAEKAV